MKTQVAVAVEGLAIGVVEAFGAAVEAPPLEGLKTEIPEHVRKAVRDMLRYGKYKPTGRGKPASEYLLGAALEGQFPRVSPLVDWCNVASLTYGVPISLIDLQRAGVSAFQVRRGRAGESYVFNAGGQTIELEDLLLTAKMPIDEPCANTVKDSLATKLTRDARDVLAVIYAPAALAAHARGAGEMLAKAYRGEFFLA